MSIKPPLDLASASKVLKNSQRILVLGAPGSGKSFAATKLSELLSLPLISLDLVFWKPQWSPLPLDQFKEECLKLAMKESWIMDGNFGTTFEERWSRADFVLYLDTNPWLAFFRQVMRSWGFMAKISRPKECPERANQQLFWLTYKFRKSHGVLIKERMRSLYPEVDFLQLRNSRELKTLLNSLEDH